jgi:hypothetical protein
VEAFLSALPCGLHLLAVGNEGRFVIGTFRLTPRPGSLCGNPGELMRIAFVVAGGKFQEWRQVAPGAPAGPDEPEPEPGALVA